jgi:hypothetical protein
VEKNDRTDLAEKIVTRKQVEQRYERTTTEPAINKAMMFKNPVLAGRAERLQMSKKQSHPQAPKSEETTLDNTSSFREGHIT